MVNFGKLLNVGFYSDAFKQPLLKKKFWRCKYFMCLHHTILLQICMTSLHNVHENNAYKDGNSCPTMRFISNIPDKFQSNLI
jgi:hypothetical protein